MKTTLTIDIRNKRLTSVLHNLSFELTTFPGGERHVKIPCPASIYPHEYTPVIHQDNFHSPADVFDVVLVNDALRRLGFSDIECCIPYFPGARQDRVCSSGEALSAAVYANIINSCGFSKVHIMTPHSDVAPALIHNVNIIPDIVPILDLVVTLVSPEINIIIPDAGAAKRTHKIADEVRKFKRVNVYQCEKVRDVTNGNLSGFKLYADDLKGLPTLVIDDIVANGGTFLGLAPIIREKNCGELMIHVTHADSVKGLLNLSPVYDTVSFVRTKTHMCEELIKAGNVISHAVPYYG